MNENLCLIVQLGNLPCSQAASGLAGAVPGGAAAGLGAGLGNYIFCIYSVHLSVSVGIFCTYVTLFHA